MILESLRLTAKNISLITFPLASLFLLYLIMVFAVLTAMPTGELQKIISAANESVSNATKYVKNVEKIEKEVVSSLKKNLGRTVIVFLLFGLFGLFVYEYFSASLIVAAKYVAMTGSFSFKKALEEGMVYTLPVLVVDFLCSLGVIAFFMPFYVAYYATGYEGIVRVSPLAYLFVAPLLVMPKYVVVVRGESALNSIAVGFRIAIRNYPSAFSAFAFCTLIVLLCSAFPPLMLFGIPFAYALLSVCMCTIAEESSSLERIESTLEV